MTDYTGQQQLLCDHSVIVLTKQDIVNCIWKWENNTWKPNDATNPLPTGGTYIRLLDDELSTKFVDLSLLIESTNDNAPLLAISQGVVVKKDLAVGGFLSANQGLIALCSGHLNSFDPPGIWLSNSAARPLDTIETRSTPPTSDLKNQQCYIDSDNNHLYQYNGSSWVDIGHKDNYTYYFDTCYIRKAGYTVPLPFTTANVPISNADLGNLACAKLQLGSDTNLYRYSANVLKTDDSLIVDGAITIAAANYIYFGGADTYLQREAAGVISVKNNGSLGTIDVSNLFADHINSASSAGIYTMDTIKSNVNGAGYCSYYGGGGGGANGGIYLDAYGWVRFNGSIDTYWYVRTNTGNEVLAVPNATGTTRAIWISCNMNPNGAGVLGCGSGSNYWAGVVTNTIYRRYEQSFDALDDLSLAKNYKTKTVIENGLEKETVDLETLPHLKADPTPADAKLADFWDEGKVSGFLLGCVKALVHRVEALEEQLKEQAKAD